MWCNVCSTYILLPFVYYFKSLQAVNESLEILDLSWNHIRRRSAAAFALGIKVRRERERSYDIDKIDHDLEVKSNLLFC